MKKIKIITEAKRKALLAEREKAIIESFSKNFNMIKRIDEADYNDGEDYERIGREIEYGVDPYADRPELIMPRVGDEFQNVDVKLQDGTTAKRDVKVIAIYPDTEEVLVRTNFGGDAIVDLYDLVR